MKPASSQSAPSIRLGWVSVVAAAAISVALGAVGPDVAAGHTASVSSQHSLTLSSGGFSGQVTSGLPECASGRSITLYRADATGAVAVASAVTDSNGAWSRPADSLQGGDFYALAARVLKTSAGHKHTCEPARSNTVTLPSDSDADGDGYTATGGDCADTDPRRHPGAADNTQNGIDDDCDGTIDEDYRAPVFCDATSYFAFDPDTGTWSCAPLQSSACPIDADGYDAASAEWNDYLAADPTLSDPVLAAGLTYPLDAYITCFGF